jgi:hypothetical protein
VLQRGSAARRNSRPRRREAALEHPAQGVIHRFDGHAIPQRGEARHAVVADSARHDAREVLQIGIDVDGKPVRAHPAPQPHPDRGDLVVPRRAALLPPHPNADPAVDGARLHTQLAHVSSACT